MSESGSILFNKLKILMQLAEIAEKRGGDLTYDLIEVEIELQNSLAKDIKAELTKEHTHER